MNRLHESLTLLAEAPWAILPDALRAIVMALQGPPPAAAARPGPARTAGQVAVIPIAGPIYPRGGWLAEMLGMTTIDNLTASLRQAMTDPAVAGIVLDVDSPGGSVAGVDELSAEIYKARGTKPVIAVANHMAASAAYWLATAADQLLVTPSAEVGSVGVFAMHEDLSAAAEQAGVRVTYVSAGKYKTEGNPFSPLGEEARAALQARVDEYYAMFTRSLARNRQVGIDQVRQGFGEGRMVGARQAVDLGMADAIGTFDDAVALAARQARQGGKSNADLERRQRRARALNDITGAVAP